MKQHYTKKHEPYPNQTCDECGKEFHDSTAERKYCDSCWDGDMSGSNNPNYRDAKEETECLVCGEEFSYYPSDKEGIYCNKHQDEATTRNLRGVNEGKEEVRCCSCGEYYEISGMSVATDPDTKVFCTYECKEDLEKKRNLSENRYYGIEASKSFERVQCESCGREILRQLGKRVEKGHFCSEDCFNSWFSENRRGENHHQWKDWDSGYSGDWWRVRREVQERDDGKCQLCGSGAGSDGRAPDAHHIWPVAWFRAHDEYEENDAHTMENVVLLCQSCHRNVEYDNKELPDELLDEKELVEPPASYVELRNALEAGRD